VEFVSTQLIAMGIAIGRVWKNERYRVLLSAL
jgi:hypothetical protein